MSRGIEERTGPSSPTPAHQRAALVVSQELAKALAGPWRTKVLLELTLRPMSPSQFVREVGGERSHIALCFRQLAKWGFIELVDERRGGRRRGGVEHVYRAVRRARIDDETAEKLPLPLREDISVNILTGYFGQVSKAAESGTFDDQLGRHLSCGNHLLDAEGWRVLMDRLNETLNWLPTHRLKAADRIARSGEQPVLTTVALAGFRASTCPDPGQSIELTGIEEAGEELGGAIISHQLAKALSSPWRARILAEVSVRPMSPSEFADEFGGDLSHVSRCFRQLAKAGYLELVQQRRGAKGSGPAAVEHVYRSVRKARLSAGALAAIPPLVRNKRLAGNLDRYLCKFVEAFDTGTFDADTDRHISWDMLWLDEEGRADLAARLDQIRAWVPELEADAKRRLAASGEDPITTTVALAAFHSPSPPRLSG